jgi:solute carrier family 35 protein E3
MSEFYSRLKLLSGPFRVALSIIASITLIQINKYIYLEYNFPNMTLTFLHFVSISIGLLACRHFNFYKHIELPRVKILFISALFCICTVLTNFSLEMNSISTYQCLKTITIPGTMLIFMFYYKYTFSLQVKLSVVSWIKTH